jgi:hypothetical protein
MSDIITLNVGGTIFTTSRSTLCKIPDSVFYAMFSSNSQMMPSVKDQNGNYFIDRDPECFKGLFYLRI